LLESVRELRLASQPSRCAEGRVLSRQAR